MTLISHPPHARDAPLIIIVAIVVAIVVNIQLKGRRMPLPKNRKNEHRPPSLSSLDCKWHPPP